MPHIIIEHSENISSSAVNKIFPEIQNIMFAIKEGNFDLEQCKARAISFDKYLVGSKHEEKSAFLHITIKILAGRSVEVRKKLAEKVMDFAKKSYENLVFSPSEADKIILFGEQVADMISGAPIAPSPLQNRHLADKRCDISVDIVEMDRETYQKLRIGE